MCGAEDAVEAVRVGELSRREFRERRGMGSKWSVEEGSVQGHREEKYKVVYGIIKS